MHKQQRGFVSIIVASVLMVLLSLVTIGFSRYMQREQRQALDRQLSTQAFYAAETAVNDVYSRLDDNTLPNEKTDCDVTDWPINGANGAVDVTGNEPVNYTCLIYDKTPDSLLFTDSITTSRSKIFPIQSADTTETISTLKFTWNGEFGSTTIDTPSSPAPETNVCTNNPDLLPTQFASGTVPMLRMDIIQAPTAGYDREYLIDNTASIYLYPKNCGFVTGSFGNYIGAQKGQVVNVNCSSGLGCEFTVTGLSEDKYVVRVRSVYTNVGTLLVEATDSSGNDVEFLNAQTLVDATGKANDVLRRIETRIANTPDFPVPEGVIDATDICKLIKVAPENPATSSVVVDADCY